MITNLRMELFQALVWPPHPRHTPAHSPTPRRTDYHQFSKFWLAELLNETFYLEAMSYLRTKHSSLTFLVLSDDLAWCQANLRGEAGL